MLLPIIVLFVNQGGLGNHPSLYKIFPLNVERSKQMLNLVDEPGVSSSCLQPALALKKPQFFHFLAHCFFCKLTSP